MSWTSLLKQWTLVALLVLLADRLIGALLLPLYAPDRPAWRAGQLDVNHAYGHLRSAVLARADMLIVGSSRALTNYQDELLSRELGLRVYNAGSPGMGVLQARATLALARRFHPVRYLLLDEVFIPKEDRMIHQLEPWLDSHPVVNEVLQSDWRERLKTRSYAYRCGGSVFDLAQDYGKAGRPWGYQALQEISARPPDLRPNLPARLPDWFPEQLDALAQDCQKGGVTLILCASPTLTPISPEQPVAMAYQRLAQRYHLWQLPAPSLPADQDYFFDTIHLNRQGAELFTGELAVNLRGIKNSSQKKESE